MVNEIVTASDIYWISRLDDVRSLLFVLAGVASLAALIMLVHTDCNISFDEEKDRRQRAAGFKMVKQVAAIGVLCGAAGVFTPSTRDAVAMVVVPKIANNQDVQGLGSDVVKVARQWLDELRPKGSK